MDSLTAIILTYNEEQHIARCITSLKGIAGRVCVIDSHSTDATTNIAQSLGAEVHQNPWAGHATQFQWALDTLKVTSDWTLRIDADEYLDPGLQTALEAWLTTPRAKINGVFLRRQVTFLGQPIRHGFFYPLKILRLWRTGHGRMEQRRMDEHIILDQPRTTVLSGGDLVDDNLNDLSWWIAKHDGYAMQEAIAQIEAGAPTHHALTGPARTKRWVKQRLYTRLPASLRAGPYFLYRYILGAGFLDGTEGLYFHYLQAFWYRSLVEAKRQEIGKRAKAAGVPVREWIKQLDAL